jgi:hypothetical protein
MCFFRKFDDQDRQSVGNHRNHAGRAPLDPARMVCDSCVPPCCDPVRGLFRDPLRNHDPQQQALVELIDLLLELALDRAFPWRIDQIIAVVDAATPEAAEEAANTLADDLSHHADVIRTVSRPDGGEFFARNGILFRSLDEVRRDADDLIGAQPFLGTLSADPTLRGVLRTLSQSIEGLRLGKTKLEDLRPALTEIADTLEIVSSGKYPAFSWRKLITGRTPEPSDLRRFINIQPVLDFDDLQPGRKATATIREAASRLG